MRRKHIFGGIFGGGSLARRRGSVLLMVIGLLTILALLGSTFLFVARSYRKTSKALTYRYQATPLASGSLTRVVQLLKEDLRIDPTNGPYGDIDDGGALDMGDTTEAVQAWKRYIDSPTIINPIRDLATTPIISADQIDEWLACIDPSYTLEDEVGTNVWAWRWQHLTNMFEDPGAAFLNSQNRRTDAASLADSDGDSIADAYYGPSTSNHMAKVMNELGEKYYIGVRVIDLAGLININTACGTDAALGAQPAYGAPVSMDLYNFISPALYTRTSPEGLNRERYSTAAATPDGINTNIALHLLSPTANYNPFAIGDEMYLRWLEVDSLTETGRVYDAIGTLSPIVINPNPNASPLNGQESRRYLTTYNCSRSLLRVPDATYQTKLDLGDPAILDTDAIRQAFYSRILETAYPLYPLSPAPMAIREEVAHFIANLWAYISPYDQNQAFAFQPSGESWTVYGVIEQPVIGEGYAYSLAQDYEEPPSAPGTVQAVANSSGYAYAIELFNPTSQPITLTYDSVNNRGYRLEQGANTYTFPANPNSTPIVLGAYGRIVVYCYDGQMIERASYPHGAIQYASPNVPNRIASTAAGYGFTDEATTGTNNGWLNWTALDLSDTTPVRLVRVTNDGTTIHNIPMDRIVGGTDVGYNITNRTTNDTSTPTLPFSAGDHNNQVVNNGCRDDSTTRQRATIPVYYRPALVVDTPPTLPTPTFANHTLYAGNGVTVAQLPETTAYSGFPIVLAHASPANLGDFSYLYLYGPDDQNSGLNDLPHLLSPVQANIARGRVNYLVDVVPPVTTAGATYSYPDVPWTSLLSEFFERIPVDPTRPVTPISDRTRIYGKININTAPRAVLERLPWPAFLDLNNNGTQDANLDLDGNGTIDVTNEPTVVVSDLVDLILAYRNLEGVFAAGRAIAGMPANLRSIAGPQSGSPLVDTPGSNCIGFLTAGEISIPLASYADALLTPAGVQEQNYCYQTARDSVYRAVSNLITVNSDVYAVYIYVKANEEGAAGTADAKSGCEWRYIAVVDRSNCRDADDTPAVLLFSELK